MRRFSGDGAVGAYVHHNGKVAVLVEIAGVSGDEVQQSRSTIAEHIAAGSTVPVAVDREDVPAEMVERERRIFVEQAAATASRSTSSRRSSKAGSRSSTRTSRCSISRGCATTARRSAIS